MTVVFIYGPPASGKLTVAQELAKVTRFPVFHNHLTRDLVLTLFPGELAANYELVNTLRDDVFRYCAARGVDIIFTFVYDGPDDDATVRRRVDAVERHGGEVVFVELVAPHEELLARVGNGSRRAHRKLTDRAALESLLGSVAYPSVPYPDVLKVDTAAVRPARAAELIASRFRLAG